MYTQVRGRASHVKLFLLPFFCTSTGVSIAFFSFFPGMEHCHPPRDFDSAIEYSTLYAQVRRSSRACRPFFWGNGQKRELPVGSWPETGGQKYEGSKHSIWAHVIGLHHLPPVSGRTPTGTSRFSLLWSAPTRFWPHFVALQSIRSDQPGVEQLHKYPAQMTWVPVVNGRKVMWALATAESRLL